MDGETGRRVLDEEAVSMENFEAMQVNLENKLVAMMARRDHFDRLDERNLNLRVMNMRALIFNEDGGVVPGGDVVDLRKLAGALRRNDYAILAVSASLVRVGYRFDALPRGFGTSRGACVVDLEINDPDMFMNLVTELDPGMAVGRPQELVMVSEKTVASKLKVAVNSAIEEIISGINVHEMLDNQILIRGMCVGKVNSYLETVKYGLHAVDVHLFFDLNRADVITRNANERVFHMEAEYRVEQARRDIARRLGGC